ncbi:MAG: alpha-1,2-fucosyltransferase [Suilimivivens sp.]
MNIIRMTGGLGNQMFQYALYLKLISMGREVKFDDISEYEPKNARPVMLWCFGIDYPKASREEINEITDGFVRLRDRVRRKLFGRKSLEYHEADCDFDPEVLIKDPAYLTGYFQSELYFKDIEDKVRKAFSFQSVIFDKLSEDMKKKVLAYRDDIDGSLAISLHVRRGDYLTSSEIYGGNCTDEYYKSAIALMREKYPEAVFFVFSNDEIWTREWIVNNFPEENTFISVQGTSEETGYLDLYLMSRCRHHILANSSFSWWGAYLNPSKDKTVIAPARWFNNQECRDIYTPEMIRISSKGEIVVNGTK